MQYSNAEDNLEEFEWNENDTYRIAGTHYPEYNLVEFNLNQARIVQFGEIE